MAYRVMVLVEGGVDILRWSAIPNLQPQIPKIFFFEKNKKNGPQFGAIKRNTAAILGPTRRGALSLNSSRRVPAPAPAPLSLSLFSLRARARESQAYKASPTAAFDRNPKSRKCRSGKSRKCRSGKKSKMPQRKKVENAAAEKVQNTAEEKKWKMQLSEI